MLQFSQSFFTYRPSAREIEFVKSQNVGIRLAGGNDVGIFVASVQESSAAAKKGLRMGDQIMSVRTITNFVNLLIFSSHARILGSGIVLLVYCVVFILH